MAKFDTLIGTRFSRLADGEALMLTRDIEGNVHYIVNEGGELRFKKLKIPREVQR